MSKRKIVFIFKLLKEVYFFYKLLLVQINLLLKNIDLKILAKSKFKNSLKLH